MDGRKFEGSIAAHKERQIPVGFVTLDLKAQRFQLLMLGKTGIAIGMLDHALGFWDACDILKLGKPTLVRSLNKVEVESFLSYALQYGKENMVIERSYCESVMKDVRERD